MHIFVGVCILFALSFTSGCSRYEVSINKNVIYTPPTLFSDYTVYDSYLNDCLKSTIRESNITDSKQLTRLICPAGNITNLGGIEQFPMIEFLGMQGNKIQNIEPLAALKNLKQVNMSENHIEDFSALQQSQYLVFLDARANLRADCASLVFAKTIDSLALPEHCK